MIHYALPIAPPNFKDLEAFRYGDLAIPALVNSLSDLIAKKPLTFLAKIVGGAQNISNMSPQSNVGSENTMIAWKILADFGISVVGSDVGGMFGRKVLFHVQDGRLQVASLDKSPWQN
jgi:chemotaxis protein CheD